MIGSGELGIVKSALTYGGAIPRCALTVITALALGACGSSTAVQGTPTVTVASTSTRAPTPAQPHRPQVVEPVAGQQGSGTPKPGAGTSTAGTDPPAPSLSQPASVTHVPAKGAPSNAEVRAAVARFQLAVARYHLDKLDLSGALLNPDQLPPGEYNTSIASVYTDYGLGIACGGILHVAMLGVANKTLPCGTEVIFRYGGRAVRVPVIDRGPYIAGRDWDLTGATAEALRFPGLGPIQWRLAG
jgi:rare lipoprotein A (peptidoglycan hydrolase)